MAPTLDQESPATGTVRRPANPAEAPADAGLAIPDDVIRNWQRIVDLLASIVRVPSAVVTALELREGAYYTTIVSSHSTGNPFPAGDRFGMDIGTFCETVIKTREPLLVGNALEEAGWGGAPEIGVGMVSYLGYPVLWPDGRVFGTICVLDDKTNRYTDLYQELLRICRDVLQGDLQTLVRLSSEMEAHKAQLHELFMRVPEAIVMVDGDSRITRVNPGFTKIFGYPPEEALGRRVKELLMPEDLHAEGSGYLERMLRAREMFSIETVRRHRSGARMPVAILYVPVSSGNGRDAGFLLYRDLTQARRLQDEQRRYHALERELEQAHRVATIGELSASIAHELNQPLTGIITNCGTCQRMLAATPANVEGAREVVARTMRDGNRASAIVSRLRALFARHEPASDLVDLNDATREVIALTLDELEKGRVTVRAELADDLPPVKGDRVQLQQVVLNLLRNALDAMSAVDDPAKELVIATARQGSEQVRLSVTDAGVGFDPGEAQRLFEPFYTTKSDGMGVGLSVCRSIVEHHKGQIAAVLNDGPGATFHFTLPCVQGA